MAPERAELPIDFLLSVFDEHRHDDAIVWHDQTFSYEWLLDQVAYWRARLEDEDIGPGVVTSLEGDFSPNSVAAFLALLRRGAVIVPLNSAQGKQHAEFKDIAQVEASITVAGDDNAEVQRVGRVASHELYDRLREIGHPGLVVFSSGSTGTSKAIVHDMVPILEKFKVQRRRLRMMTFLLFDHLGGINTMLYIMSNGGCMVTLQDRRPDAVLAAVERHRVELLPTSPTFINLILITEAYRRHDLSSLQTVSFGTEAMPDSTLARFHELFPKIKLLQTYGLTELGVLRSKSRSSGSPWMKVGGEGFATRIVEGRLQVQAASAMLGYLNAPSPFAEDGWLDTGDVVEVDGEWIRILGRETDIINVGGQKVFPAKVESTIQEMGGVAEVSVYGEPNPITGNIVCAHVTPLGMVDPTEFAADVKRHCAERLPRYMTPVKVAVSDDPQHSARYKKLRSRTT